MFVFNAEIALIFCSILLQNLKLKHIFMMFFKSLMSLNIISKKKAYFFFIFLLLHIKKPDNLAYQNGLIIL